MKLKLISSLIVFVFYNLTTNAQQITTSNNLPLEQLIQNSLGENCVEISDIVSSVNGAVSGLDSYGFFERGNSNFPFENGIVLTTGNVNSAGNTLITENLNEGNDDWLTDPDLENALGLTDTQNATSIQFKFISVANQISFNYILASEEYIQNFPCSYSDGFAFLIREAGSADPFTNIALIPGTNIPVNTSTIHEAIPGNAGCPAENAQFFEGYNVGDTNYNGRTTVLTATADIIPNQQYEIKIVIADQDDENFDSAVFIQGNSFNASVDLGPDITTCGSSILLNGDIQNNQATYQWYQNNTLINGENNAELEVTTTGTYRVEVTIQLNQTSCVIEDTIEVTLNSEQSSGVLSDFAYCDDASNDGIEDFDLSLKDGEVLASVPSSTYNITYHYSQDDAQNNANAITGIIQNTSSPQPIFVRIEDVSNGCLAFSTFNLVVNEDPVFVEPDPIVACQDPTQDEITYIDLTAANSQIIDGNADTFVSYHFSQPEADLGINPIFSPYPNNNISETIYVRVYNGTTGCYATTTLSVVFQSGPPVNEETPYISACEQDFDGYDTFDLTSAIDFILNGFTDATVTFHETYFAALNDIDAIADPENYANIVPTFQVIFVSVVDNTTGCYTITELELHANIIQTVYSGENFTVCDDSSNDGIEDFDLMEIREDLEDGYDDFETTFYATEDDRTNETNPLDQTIPFTVSNNGTTIYAIVISDECTEFVEIDLIIAPHIILEPQSVEVCDNFGTIDDGVALLTMADFDLVAAQGVTPFNVEYYLTEENAINDESRLPDLNYSNPMQPIYYIRVTNTQSECYGISTLEVNVIDAPEIIYPDPILVCDDDGDGISTVNLDAQIPNMVTNTDGLEFSFYLNYSDAELEINALENTDSYTTATQYIYTRVENTTTGCPSFLGFYVYVNTLPEFPTITNFENCEADISGVADFLFYLKDNEILNGQFDKFVTYYETEADAEAGVNSINKFINYQNTSSPQTIYVRVQNFTDSNCYGVSSFELEVGALPIYNPAESILICDDISNDQIVTIDLNETISAMANGSPETLDITFYTTQFDADNLTNAVDLNYTNSSNPQQLFARVDNGNYCYGISPFEINIIPAPLVNEADPLVACDTDYDGFLTWDLTISEDDILDVRQDDIVVSYFETLDDLEADTNPILNPEAYTNITNPQTVYVKVNNEVSNCYVYIPVDISVNLPPPVNDFQSVEICDNAMSSFDLLTINALVTGDTTGINFSYHNSQAEAETGTNPLDTNYTYTNPTHTFVVRLTYNETGCYTTYPFDLIINPLPTANPPQNMQACDDLSNDGFEIFDLVSQNSSILQGQDPSIFAVSFHNSQSDANNGENALPENYNAQHNETIYVRVTNVLTGCFETTLFSTIIYEAPSSVDPITICDTDYDGINTFDLTAAELDLYPVIPANISTSYFESIADLELNVNAIPNPEAYQNLSNPQTIYIRVFNNAANCYTTIPLDINTLLPPPTNDFGVYEICDNPDSSFDLSELETVIVDDTANVLFSYFSSFTDAENNVNALSENYTYTTTNDVIVIRVEDATTGCFYIYDVTLQINPLPIANQPADMEICDDDGNDGSGDFDLASQTNSVLGSQSASDFTVTYHVNTNNAVNAIDPLENIYIGSDGQVIIVRIENNDTGCFNLTDFSLTVNPFPNVPNPLVACDVDYDGITTFNLTLAEEELFSVNNPDDSISYFESMEDLDNNSNAINDVTDYTNLSNPQTVFIRVYNSVADCYRAVPLELNASLPPPINDFQVYEICDNETNSFDLNTIDAVIVHDPTDVVFSYFLTEEDAELNENPLATDYTYTTTNDIIYARVAYTTTSCYHIYPFELLVNPLPEAYQPEDMIFCDDDFNGILSVNLSTQTQTILGSQDPMIFSVSYYNSLALAEQGVQSLDSEAFNAYNGQTITARVTNEITGCYQLVDFQTIINRRPVVDIPPQVVCLNNLPLIVSADTGFDTDTYLWSTNAITSQIEITELGTYSVTVTSEFGCETTSTFTVTESESAIIELTETLDFSDPNNITVTISGIGDYLYQLDDGEPQESNVFENVAMGYHLVTVIDLNGCDRVIKEVLVIDIPKHMTPNNDGQYDRWHIIGVETLPGTVIHIFDRYGKLLKILRHNTQGWDGTYNGHRLPASDYWFVADVKHEGEIFQIKGHFAIRR